MNSWTSKCRPCAVLDLRNNKSWSPLPCGGIPALPGIPPEVAPPNSVTPRHLNNLLLSQVTTTGNSLRGPRNCGTDLLDASGGRKFRRIVVVGPLCPRATPEFPPRLSTAFRRRPRVPRFTRRRGSETYVLRIVVRLATTRQRRTQIFLLRESRFFLFLLQNVQLSSVGPWYWKRRRLRRRWWCCTTVFTVHQPAVGLVQSGDGPAAAAASAETP